MSQLYANNEFCKKTDFKVSANAADYNMKRLVSLQNLSQATLELNVNMPMI